jgi:hypothetical protein
VAHAEWNHRLNIQNILCSAIRTYIEVAVVLDRNTDKACDRILRGLLKVARCGSGRRSLIRLSLREQWGSHKQERDCDDHMSVPLD